MRLGAMCHAPSPALLALMLAGFHLGAIESTVVTLAFTVLKQPNIAVGFVDVDPASGCAALQLGQLADEGRGVIHGVDLSCDPSDDSLRLTFNGTIATFKAGTSSEWSYDARQSPAFTWRTKVPMVDMMYDTAFDAEDALIGTFTVSSNNAFLQSNFGWVQGTSSMADVQRKNAELKAASGRCPMLSMGHRRVDDFAYPKLVAKSMERYEWFLQYVQEKQGGVLQGTKDVVDKLPECA